MDFLEKLNIAFNADFPFWFCALSGSGLLLIQLTLSFNDDFTIESGKARWLSKQAAAIFLTMFGWSTLAFRYELGFDRGASIAIGTLIGLTAVLIIGLIFNTAKKLESPGNVFKIEDAIGKEATVYQRIPKNGSGKVSLSLYGFTFEIEAIADVEVASFVLVKIVKIVDNKTVLVIPIKQ